MDALIVVRPTRRRAGFLEGVARADGRRRSHLSLAPSSNAVDELRGDCVYGGTVGTALTVPLFLFFEGKGMADEALTQWL